MTKLEVVASASEEQQHQVDGAAVCLQGDRVYTAADDGKVKVFDHHDLKLVHEFDAHEYAVTDLLVLGASLFTCSVDCTLKVWDAATCQLRATTSPHEEALRKMATNGVHVFAGDEKGEVRLYDIDGRCKATHSMVEEVWGLCAEENILYSVRDRGVTISQLHAEKSNKSTVVGSVEGRAPLVVTDNNLVSVDMSGFTIIVRDTIKGSYKPKGELKGHEMIITAMAGCGPRLASTGWDNDVRLWDLSALQHLASCKVPACATSITMSEDGCIFVTGSGGYVCKMKAS